MNQPEADRFPSEIARKLGSYVYRLIDPRNGETFYVGKGQGDRVFAHIHAARDLEGDDLDNKIKRIRAIQLAGFEVNHVIHRHGMDDQTAIAVEAALIDAYPGLTNVVGGTGSDDYGAMHALEIIRKYSVQQAEFQHRALLVSINRSASERSLYDATRSAWKLDKSKAEQAEVILPTRQGEIVGAFIARHWMEVTTENFSERDPMPGRYGFDGTEAPEAIRTLYVGRRVPEKYRRRGASNPVRYTW